jgi:hypothetical protein
LGFFIGIVGWLINVQLLSALPWRRTSKGKLSIHTGRKMVPSRVLFALGLGLRLEEGVVSVIGKIPIAS